MKSAFYALLAANLALGAWLLTHEPVGVLREPGRASQQVAAERFRLLSDADLEQMRRRAAAAEAQPSPSAAEAGLPQPDCIVIGDFASEAAARKFRGKLAEAGVAEARVAADPSDPKSRLRVSGIDAAVEARIQDLLKDRPKLELEHCIDKGGTR
jgi:hypothetical protein